MWWLLPSAGSEIRGAADGSAVTTRRLIRLQKSRSTGSFKKFLDRRSSERMERLVKRIAPEEEEDFSGHDSEASVSLS